MVNQKIIMKNSATMTGTIIIVILIMAMFFGAFNYIIFNTTDSNQTLDIKYYEIEENLTDYQTDLESKTQDVRDDLKGMTQAEEGWAQVWNGIAGLATTILLFKSFISAILGVLQSLLPSLEVFPSFVVTLVFVGVFAFIIILIIKIAKGEPNM